MNQFIKVVDCPVLLQEQKLCIKYSVAPDGKIITKTNGCEFFSGCAKCKDCIKPFVGVFDSLPE